jgi:hypothetical protein
VRCSLADVWPFDRSDKLRLTTLVEAQDER